jgi:hypothetical protein
MKNNLLVTSGRKRLCGVGAKEQRMYEHIKKQAESSGRYSFHEPSS